MDSGRAKQQKTTRKEAPKAGHSCIFKSGLSCLYINARSIFYKLNILIATIKTHDYDIVLVTETWLCEKILSSEINIKGYRLFRCDRQIAARGGGVLLYIKDDLNAMEFAPNASCMCMLKLQFSTWQNLQPGNSIVRDVTFAEIALMFRDIISVIQQFTIMYMTVQGAHLSSYNWSKF